MPNLTEKQKEYVKIENIMIKHDLHYPFVLLSSSVECSRVWVDKIWPFFATDTLKSTQNCKKGGNEYLLIEHNVFTQKTKTVCG